MKTLNTLYSPYSDKVNALYDKEFELNERLKATLTNTRAELRSLCARYNFLTPINTLFDTIKANTSENNTKKAHDLTIEDIKHIKHPLLAFKLRLYITLVNRYETSNNRLLQYKLMKMPYSTFNNINSTVNSEIAKSILRGYNFKIGLGEIKIGNIAVEKIERKFDLAGHPLDRSVNWEESNTFKQALIEDGVEVYNKDTAPNGRRWFIYHDEPYIYYINWQVSMYSH